MENILNLILPISFFFFGAIIGSFLNVVILRYRSGRTLGGRSMCFSCGKTLSWFELIPIGSFLTQRGKCEGCETKISWQYPLVEAFTGTVFMFLYFHFQSILLGTPLLFGILFAYYAVVFSVLIVLSVYDIKHKILPDGLVALFAGLAFVGLFFIEGTTLAVHIPTLSPLLAGILLPAPFALIWLVSRGKWMGLGDAKLMVGIGFLLGMSSGIVALLFSFWIGAIVSIGLLGYAQLSHHKMSLKTEIPFGPFLVLSTIIVVLGSINLTILFHIIGG